MEDPRRRNFKFCEAPTMGVGKDFTRGRREMVVRLEHKESDRNGFHWEKFGVRKEAAMALYVGFYTSSRARATWLSDETVRGMGGSLATTCDERRGNGESEQVGVRQGEASGACATCCCPGGAATGLDGAASEAVAGVTDADEQSTRVVR